MLCISYKALNAMQDDHLNYCQQKNCIFLIENPCLFTTGESAVSLSITKHRPTVQTLLQKQKVWPTIILSKTFGDSSMIRG